MKLLKKILTFIKNEFNKSLVKKDNKIEYTNIEYDKLYSDIEFGDIIWAKRYYNDEERELIPEGHEEGPFLVAKKEDGKLYCFYGTSTFNENDMFISLNNLEYNLTKETYFKLHKMDVIDKFTFVKKLNPITDSDKDKLYRKIKYFHRVYHDKNKIINIELPRQCGDIVLHDNKKYIVLDIMENKLICIQMGYVNRNASNLNYSKTFMLDDDNIKTIGALSNKQLIVALNNYKEYISNKENVNETKRGSIIYLENKYYYVYGEEGQNLLTFEITKKPIENYDNLVLGNIYFYTLYNERIINKKDQYQNFYLCLKQEIDTVKEQRKKYKNLHFKPTQSNIEIPQEIKKGSYIKLNEFSEELFYVCDIIGDVAVCVAHTERGKKLMRKQYFNKENLILVENIQKRR